jgi:hypothetical protein
VQVIIPLKRDEMVLKRGKKTAQRSEGCKISAVLMVKIKTCRFAIR